MTLSELNHVLQPDLDLFGSFSNSRRLIGYTAVRDIDLTYIKPDEVRLWTSYPYYACFFVPSVETFQLWQSIRSEEVMTDYQPYSIYIIPSRIPAFIRLNVIHLPDMENDTFDTPKYSIQLPMWMKLKFKRLMNDPA